MTSATKWRVVTLPGSELMQIWNDSDQVIARISTREQPGAELPDATLIAEAGTVFHECGLSPRELLEAVRSMRQEMEAIRDCAEEDGKSRDYASRQAEIRGIARAALAKHKEV